MLVRDIHPAEGTPSPYPLGVVGGVAYFIAGMPATGNELFRTDGTTAGTRMVAEIIPGPLGTPLRDFTPLGSFALFAADDFDHGMELWRTDGTAAGTMLVRDIEPGWMSSLEEYYATGVHVLGGAAFFVAGESAGGGELWRSTGTAAGAQRLVDLAPGPASFSPYRLTVHPPWLYFTGPDFDGRQLWRTDGTAPGTTLVTTLPGTFYGGLVPAANGRLYFLLDEDGRGMSLWTSDGTAAGTHFVFDADPAGGPFEFTPLAAFGDRVLFFADDGVRGAEPFVSDGTLAGTVPLGDLWPGAPDSLPLYDVGAFEVIGAQALFVAGDPGHGFELWKTDGTPAGTSLYHDFVAGPATPATQRATFAGRLGAGVAVQVGFPPLGVELYFVDGVAAPNRLTSLGDEVSASWPGSFADADGTVLFAAEAGGASLEAWRSDGTTAGTYELEGDLGVHSQSLSFTPVGGGIAVGLG